MGAPDVYWRALLGPAIVEELIEGAHCDAAAGLHNEEPRRERHRRIDNPKKDLDAALGRLDAYFDAMKQELGQTIEAVPQAELDALPEWKPDAELAEWLRVDVF